MEYFEHLRPHKYLFRIDRASEYSTTEFMPDRLEPGVLDFGSIQDDGASLLLMREQNGDADFAHRLGPDVQWDFCPR